MRAVCLLPLVVVLSASAAFGQGPLTPPGVPAPTMKTLAQVEPRTPIAASVSTVTISQDGSYYLTGDITVATGSGVICNANNVTLDLNGFTISSTKASEDGYGVFGNGTGHFVVRNGHIRSGSTYNSGAGTVNAAGFSYGVYIPPGAATARVEDLDVTGTAVAGISANARAVTVSRCLVDFGGISGIDTLNRPNPVNSTVDHCVVTQAVQTAIGATVVTGCTGNSLAGAGILAKESVSNSVGTTARGPADSNNTIAGISGGQITNCRGTSTGAVPAIYGKEIRGSYGTGGSGPGMTAFTVTASVGFSDQSAGIFAVVASDSYGSSTSGTGLSTTTAQNCYGSSNSGTGIVCTNATNCNGSTSSTTLGTAGLDAQNGTATGCYAYGFYADGIRAASATNCRGSSTNGSGIIVTDTATGCTGITSAGSGLSVSTATNCVGQSENGKGLAASITATGCTGTSVSNTGLDADTALNCYGRSAQATGLRAYQATNCQGLTAGTAATSIALDCQFDTANSCLASATTNLAGTQATVIRARIAIGCSLNGFGSSTITNRYNMP